MPIEVKCIKCGKIFKVAELVDWKYSEWCDNCIRGDNKVTSQQDPREARADAKLDAMEADYEDYLRRR